MTMQQLRPTKQNPNFIQGISSRFSELFSFDKSKIAIPKTKNNLMEILFCFMEEEGHFSVESSGKILIPAFGSHDILCQIMECIVKNYQKTSKNNTQISEYIQNNIFGIEDNYQNYMDTIIKLNRILAKYEIPPVAWQKNLYFGDFSMGQRKWGKTMDLVFFKIPDCFEKKEENLEEDDETAKEFSKMVKNHYLMLFLENSMLFLKDGGKLFFIF